MNYEVGAVSLGAVSVVHYIRSGGPNKRPMPTKTTTMTLSFKKSLSDHAISGSALDFFSRTLLRRDVWMFAYDAWMIRPEFSPREQVPALVRGWRRSVAGSIQANSELPLSLLPNGSVHGMLLKYSEQTLLADVSTTWAHWVEAKQLRPIWVTAKCSFGDVKAAAFVAKSNIVDRPPLDFLLRERPELSVIKEAAWKARELNDVLATANRTDRYLRSLGRDLAAVAFATGTYPRARATA